MGRMMSILGWIAFTDGDNDTAVKWTTKARRARAVLAWLPFATRVGALANLDRGEEARTELDALLAAHPTVLKHLENGLWSWREAIIEGLHKAGLEN